MPGKTLLLYVAVFPCFFYLASHFLPAKSLAVEFIWSPAKKQMISRQCFYLDKCRGGWDPLQLPSKTDSLFFINNLVRCVDVRFKRALYRFFKYFFSVRCNDFSHSVNVITLHHTVWW